MKIMKTIFRLVSFLLCATAAIPWLLANGYAQSTRPNTCAILAGRITPDFSMQIKPADHSVLQQMFRNQVYLNCMQFHVQQGPLGETAPANGGANTTNAGTFITFDVPDALSTMPAAINRAAAVTGTYFDAEELFHSFLRSSDGIITAFDPPGATCGPSTTPAHNTCSGAVGITPEGIIVGSYADVNDVIHGYLRAPNGVFTVFDAPGSTFTNPTSINPAGAITGGFFVTGSFGAHGFSRTRNGTFTTFDPLGSTYTNPTAINPAGAITGFYIDASDTFHGFLRAPDGTITAFDPLGSTFTNPTAINPSGALTGFYMDASGTFHGFLRAPDGTFTTFDPSGSVLTGAFGINPAGIIVGDFFPPDFSVQHGFQRARDGTIIVFDPPGSVATIPAAINPAGVITGNFTPSDFSAGHGFLGRP